MRASNGRDHRSRLHCAHTRVIVEFDLPPPESTYYAPPVTLCKFADLCFGHFSKNSQLWGLRDNVLSYARQYFRDFFGESWEIWVHGGSGSTIHRAPCFWEFFFAGNGGGRFVFRFKVGPRTRCALRFGEGPRALGLSILISVRCRGVCVKRLTDSAFGAANAATTLLPLLARLRRTAKFCKCFRKRSSYAGISSTL